MTAVSFSEGIEYGKKLLYYMLGLFLTGGIIAAVGFYVITLESAGIIYLFGGMMIFLGGLVVYLGMLGLGYKVIADAVEKGNREAK